MIVIAIAICDNGCSQKHDEQFMSKDRLSSYSTTCSQRVRVVLFIIQEEVTKSGVLTQLFETTALSRFIT